MSQTQIVEKLKGGSLSGTYLFRGNKPFVRKQVSLTQNREFGFYRWLSQLKKLQSLSLTFPDLFPKVINIDTEKDSAFYDMDFVANSVNGFEFLKENPANSEIKIFFEKIVEAMDKIHSIKIPSFKGGLDLYIDQEVLRALEFCKDDASFNSFIKYETLIFNGQKTTPLITNIEKFRRMAKKYFTSPQECLTHGNITLENILYVPKERRVIFIDLYQENFIDTIYNEYSQILQSSNSYYEAYNSADAKTELNGNSVKILINRIPGLDYFNSLFNDFLHNRLSKGEIILTKLYEVSQFTRMLPFKKTVAKDKMVFFYALASNLFDSITE